MIVMPLTRKLYCLVGLIMGTRMWYSFWDAEKDDNAAFERRVDQVLREVGERGSVSLESYAQYAAHIVCRPEHWLSMP